MSFGSTSEGAPSSFIITDDDGGAFYYTGPTEHIVTMGYASTLTVAMLGKIDKVIAVDSYSTYEYTKDERLKDLKAENLGSIYTTSNNDKIKSQFVQWVEEGRMKLDDTIILTTYQNAKVLRDSLKSAGFSKVLVYLSVSNYDDIVKFTKDISMIVTGGVSKIVEDMILVKTTIEIGLASADVTEKRKGLSMWYNSSSGFAVNTTGSLSVSLIESAGGVSVAAPSITSSTRYGNESTMVQLIAENPGTVIFLSDTYTRNHNIGDFRAKYLGGDESITIVSVHSNWNNYCPDAAEGLWEFACALYPELFEGSMPHTEEQTVQDWLYYFVAGAIVSAFMVAISLIMMRDVGRKKQKIKLRVRLKDKFSKENRKKKKKVAKPRRKRLLLTIAGLSVIMIFSILLDLSWATSPLSLREVWDALIGNGTWASNIIINEINAPRVVFGVFVGSALGVTGGVMQAVFRNPLASPYLLGLSAGAALGAAIAILFTISIIPLAIAQPALAFVFCLGTMFLVYMLSRAGGSVRTETLILAGVAISSLIAAAVSLLTYIAPSEKMGDIIFWSMGSLSKVAWVEIFFAIPIIFTGIGLMLMHSKNLNAMMLGDSHAMDLGVDVRKVRLFLLIISSVVVAAAVAFVGAIGFIGLVIPHIFRLLLGPDNRLILPLSAFGGATFILLCDYVAHVVAPLYGVLPIGIVTALVGAPFFIYLLSKKRTEVGW